MAVELYNEGRVVGYSAYEIYVKQHVATADPEVPPATERQWLASSLAMGSSMLLKLPSNTSVDEFEDWMYEVEFPQNSLLCAANTILASFFKGSANFTDGSVWATRITDYGDLISNTEQSSPDDASIPHKDIDNWTQQEKGMLRDYMKIVDGVVLQNGTWTNGVNQPPQKDFSPNLKTAPIVRLHIRGKLDNDVLILLTGFTINAVVYGTSGLDSATNSPNPENGDFLGPGQYPWANKIVFSLPTSYVSYFSINNYRRKLPMSGEQQTVTDTAVIDMKTTKPETYYETNHQDSREEIDVEDFATLGDGTSVLTVFQRSTKYPPAMWGTFVDSEGQNYLNPLDVVAPGTVKMFENASEDDLKDYEDTFPGTFGMNKTDDGTLEVIDDSGNKVPAASVSVRDAQYTNLVSSDEKAKVLATSTGKNVGLSVSMSSGIAGTQYTIGSDSGAENTTVGNTTFNQGALQKLIPAESNVTWAALLEALANNKSIDLLGKDLKAIKAGIPRNYIQFPNGLRLYISATQPTDNDVPVGSIGIGWGI